MNTPTLTPADAAVLQALAASPMAAEARARHDAEQAAKRRAALATAVAARASAQADEAAAVQGVVAARAEVQRHRVALHHALALLAEAEGAEQLASAAVERIAARLRAGLADLGGDDIDHAQGVLRLVARENLGLVRYVVRLDGYGRETITEPEPEHRHRAQRLQDVVADLERLRTDAQATPAEIAAACAAAVAEATRAGAPLPPAWTQRAWVTPRH